MKASTLIAALTALDEVETLTRNYGEIDAETASRMWHSCMKAAASLRAGLICELPDLPIEKPEKEAA